MSHRTRSLGPRAWLLSLALLLGIPHLAGAVTLDTQGQGPAPSWFTCHKDIDLIKAGGKPYFKIELRGHCGVHPGDGLVGWTPVAWKEVTVRGTYNYETGAAEETIWAGPEIMIAAKLQCEKNPWAHGNACTPTQTVTNNTGVSVSWSYPLSAQRMSHLQRQVIAKWEAAPPAPTLADWVPYTTGTPDVAITQPTLGNPIPEGSASFKLEAVTQGAPFATNDQIEFEWEQILLPKDPSIEIAGKRVPYSTTSPPTSVLHSTLPIDVTTFPRGLYAVRANLAGSSDNTKTDWRMFWIGEPIPALEPYAKDDQVKKGFAIASGQKLIVFGEGQQQEMDADAALRLISRQGLTGPGGFSRIGAGTPTAAPGTPLGRPPSLPGEAKPSLSPMGARPSAIPAEGKIRTVGPVQQPGNTKVGELSPPISRELSPPVNEEETELQVKKKKRVEPVTNQKVPILR